MGKVFFYKASFPEDTVADILRFEEVDPARLQLPEGVAESSKTKVHLPGELFFLSGIGDQEIVDGALGNGCGCLADRSYMGEIRHGYFC